MRFRPSIFDRLLGLAWLIVVAAVVILLVAGYGVPVGVGALGGFLLGLVAGTIGALWLWRGSGGSITFGSRDALWSTSSVLTAEMDELGEIHSVDLGAVRSVVPVLATCEAGGLAVMLVEVELREGGVLLSFDVLVRPGTIRPGWLARVSLGDDVGTVYRAVAQLQGGWAGSTRYVATALPAPPPSASFLDARIERFADVVPGRDTATDGPWTFSVPLRSRATSPPGEA